MVIGEASVPKGTRVYAIGDIHGCLEELNLVFEKIERDLLANPVRDHTILTVGDYCDRGPDSAGVIDALMGVARKHPTVFLRGNHDQRLLEFLDIPDETGDFFLTYGGIETLASYGVSAASHRDFRELSRMLRRSMPEEHVRFLDGLDLRHVMGDYLFVHAGIRPGIPIDRQSPRDLMWIRNEFLQFSGDHGLVVVHGHTISEKPEFARNRINIDTGAFASGRLTCLVLEDDQQRLIQTGAAISR